MATRARRAGRGVKLQDVLTAAGVEPRDLASALRDSRNLVRRAAAASRVLSSGLRQFGTKATPGSKRQTAALVGSMWLERIAEETDGMLRPKGKR
jgi:hypothetical protein